MATAPAYHAPSVKEREQDQRSALTHEEPTADQIAAEAYAIYVARGASDGRDLEDWLEAERALKARR